MIPLYNVLFKHVWNYKKFNKCEIFVTIVTTQLIKLWEKETGCYKYKYVINFAGIRET